MYTPSEKNGLWQLSILFSAFKEYVNNALPWLVEWAWVYSAGGNSTNRGCAFLSLSFSFLLSRPVWPGLYTQGGVFLHLVTLSNNYVNAVIIQYNNAQTIMHNYVKILEVI